MTSPNPAHLVESLMSDGWEVAGSKYGVYVRLSWPHDKRSCLMIPLDPSYPDYDDLINAVVRALGDAVGVGRDASRALLAFDPDLHAEYA